MVGLIDADTVRSCSWTTALLYHWSDGDDNGISAISSSVSQEEQESQRRSRLKFSSVSHEGRKRNVQGILEGQVGHPLTCLLSMAGRPPKVLKMPFSLTSLRMPVTTFSFAQLSSPTILMRASSIGHCLIGIGWWSEGMTGI